MIFQSRKLEITGRTVIAQEWDAGEMTALGEICIGTGQPGALWGGLVVTELQEEICEHAGEPSLLFQWKI